MKMDPEEDDGEGTPRKIEPEPPDEDFSTWDGPGTYAGGTEWGGFRE